MKKNKFVYDELKDQFIVEAVKQDFKQRQQERRPYELAWELNMNFFVGNQYCYISSTADISDSEKQYYWENREVYNHIAPIIEARLSKLNKVVPEFFVRPLSNSDEDFYSSKLAKLILKNVVSQNNLKEVIMSANYWSEITGTSFYKLTWEDSEGEIVGTVDGKSVKSGDVKISALSPFEIYPDSNSAWDVEDCSSIITARAYPADYVNEKYNKYFKGSDIDMFELGGSCFMSGLSGSSNITKINHSKKHNQVLVIEKYTKPTQAQPNGRLTIVCENELLYDGDLPYIIGANETRTFPFIRQISSRQIGSFWGSSVIERCIPLQRSYNAIKNKKHEFISRLASGILTVEDGSVDTDNLESEGLAPGKILVYRNGARPPEFLSPSSIPEELKDEEDKLIEEMNVLSSTSDMMVSSKNPSNISSGSALSMLISQDNSRLAVVAENIRNSLVMIGKYALRLYKQFATTPRLYKISDASGSIQISYWKNNDITSDDVILENPNELDDSSSQIKSSVLSLFDKGVFGDENGIISATNKMKILNIFGLSSFESSEDISELHKARAIKENSKILEIESPLEIDNHKVHISEHTKLLIGDEGEQITQEEKQLLLEHIKQHKKMQAEEMKK